jgi:polyhydroxyalkanoate synthesis regulator phasin
MEDRIIETLERMVGDTPVSVQIATALHETASREDMNALRSDLNALREKVEKLIMLVGDTPVSEQINMTINRSEN